MKKNKQKNRKAAQKPIIKKAAPIDTPIIEVATSEIDIETSAPPAWGEAVGETKSASASCPINHNKKDNQEDDNRIIAYTLGYAPSSSRPAPAQRPFMDETSSRFAYRCLPLNIANQYGWEILSPCTFDAQWNGGPLATDLEVTIYDDGWPQPVSHFGHGVLTFHINQLFRTPNGVQLMTTGPLNRPKDGIYAMTGIIETDWSHYSFTMNWVITRPFFPIRFEKGEPIAHIMPVNLAQIEQFKPVYMPIDSNPELKEAYEAFTNSRNEFNEDLNNPESQAAKEKWQKAYFRGNDAKGCPVTGVGFNHWTKLDVKPFPGTKPTKK